MNAKAKLSDLLHGNLESLKNVWSTTEAAAESAPLPAGVYTARLLDGALCQSRNGTPGYKMTFEVVEGEYAGRRCWHDIWLTPAALAMAKRDLAKIGVTSVDQLEQPLPVILKCELHLTIRKDDEGNTFNRIKSFSVLGIDEPPKDAFDTEDPPAKEAN
jgi:hypothetical protein